MTNTRLFIKPSYLRRWEFSIVTAMMVSGFLICFCRECPGQTASQIQC